MACLLKLQIPTKAKVRFSWSNPHMQFDFALSFVKFFDPWLETCHTIMIRARTHPLTCYTSELEDSKAFPSNYKIKLQVLSWLSLQGYHQGYGLYKKEIEDAYPKKVCHMPKRYEKKESAKKREKMHTQRRYATCPQDMSKKRRKEKIYSPCLRKKIQGER